MCDTEKLEEHSGKNVCSFLADLEHNCQVDATSAELRIET
jgi:hypothetical protein